MPRLACRLALAGLALVLCLVAFPAAVASAPDPDIFPGARFDSEESAALGSDRGTPRVFRTDHPFDIVVNYYRFKRKQGVNVVEEPLAAPFERIATVLARGGSDALLSSQLVQAFHRHAFGATPVDPPRAARAWREFADRIAGPMQRIGEGDRVTIYRPYVSRSTFTVVDDTVIVLHNLGGSR